MKISGFTTVKNATKLYFPLKQSIESILPIVDEFVIALGDCDPDDTTLELIKGIASDKIKIIETKWDTKKWPNGSILAQQTDIAKNACSGDWLFYIQADEVVHEKNLPSIVKNCRTHLHNNKIDGFLFNYIHFWGDYQHHHQSHTWYPKEIRIIRNDKQIHSWRDAQSFRRIPDFKDLNYFREKGTAKLNVIPLDAQIYHYGWVRPPKYMQNKKKQQDFIWSGAKRIQREYENQSEEFHYGPLSLTSHFKGTHPKIMKEWMSDFNWGDKLQEKCSIPKNRTTFRHERLKYRFITFIEKNFLGGKQIGGFKNYNIIKEIN